MGKKSRREHRRKRHDVNYRNLRYLDMTYNECIDVHNLLVGLLQELDRGYDRNRNTPDYYTEEEHKQITLGISTSFIHIEKFRPALDEHYEESKKTFAQGSSEDTMFRDLQIIEKFQEMMENTLYLVRDIMIDIAFMIDKSGRLGDDVESKLKETEKGDDK